MTLPYQQYQELVDRYVGSIIFHGDTPIFVHDLGLGGDVVNMRCSFVGDTKDKKISYPATDPKLRDGPFVLGYINKLPRRVDDELIYGAVYATRIPARQYKQGLVRDTLALSPSGQFDFVALLGNPMFKDMLEGKYPSLKKAKTLLKGNLKSVAFSRQLAISRDELDIMKLHYRGRPVALSDDGIKFKLAKEHTYLKELLEANGVKTCQ